MKKIFLAFALLCVSGFALADTATVNFTPGTVGTYPHAQHNFYRSADQAGPFDTLAQSVLVPGVSAVFTLEAAPFYICFKTEDTQGNEGDCSNVAQIPSEVVFPGAGTIDSVEVTITIP